MKKILLATALAAFAFGAQAAITYTINTSSSGGEIAASDIGYYSLYARNLADTKSFIGVSAETEVTVAMIESYFNNAIANGTWATTQESWKYMNPTTYAGGHEFKNKTYSDGSLSFDRTGSDPDNNLFAIVFYNSGDGVERFRVVSVDKNAPGYYSGGSTSPTDKFSVTEGGTGGFWGESWNTASIPEPTSAMLMLLGVAGLALKRKRA